MYIVKQNPQEARYEAMRVLSIARGEEMLSKYKEGYTFKELASLCGVSSSRIEQICKKAFRHNLKSMDFTNFSFDDIYGWHRQLWGEVVRTSKNARKEKLTSC